MIKCSISEDKITFSIKEHPSPTLYIMNTFSYGDFMTYSIKLCKRIKWIRYREL